jgi:hypothetical protein
MKIELFVSQHCYLLLQPRKSNRILRHDLNHVYVCVTLQHPSQSILCQLVH